MQSTLNDLSLTAYFTFAKAINLMALACYWNRQAFVRVQKAISSIKTVLSRKVFHSQYGSVLYDLFYYYTLISQFGF